MINKIGFISYTVSNLQQSIKFYQNLLGLELLLKDDRWAEFNISGQRFAIHEKTSMINPLLLFILRLIQ